MGLQLRSLGADMISMKRPEATNAIRHGTLLTADTYWMTIRGPLLRPTVEPDTFSHTRAASAP